MGLCIFGRAHRPKVTEAIGPVAFGALILRWAAAGLELASFKAPRHYTISLGAPDMIRARPPSNTTWSSMRTPPQPVM